MISKDEIKKLQKLKEKLEDDNSWVLDKKD